MSGGSQMRKSKTTSAMSSTSPIELTHVAQRQIKRSHHACERAAAPRPRASWPSRVEVASNAW